MQTTTDFDATRAWLRGPDFFPRFVVDDEGSPLADSGLNGGVELIVAQRGSHSRAFVVRELSHPHMAQGRLGDEAFLVSF
ncbi:MAG: hypothetical protein V3V08_12880 [Nannocystaceae bacterium]